MNESAAKTQQEQLSQLKLSFFLRSLKPSSYQRGKL